MPLWVVTVGYILLIGGIADGKAVYAKPLADVLEANLNPLVGGNVYRAALEARHQPRERSAGAGAVPGGMT